jgi:ATP-dependent helicase/nuclease subunit A
MSQLFAYELNGQRVSRAAFYAVACDPRRSVAVEACAGAGKTWMLVSRMLRALLDGAQPHEILAITFTKKAAGEMRQRLQEWLRAICTRHTREAGHKSWLCVESARRPRQHCVEALSNLYPDPAAGRPPCAGAHLPQLVCRAAAQCAAGRAARSWACPRATSCSKTTRKRSTPCGGASTPPWWPSPRRGRTTWTQWPNTAASTPSKALEAALAKRVEFALADGQGTVDASVKPFGVQYPAFAGLDDAAEHALEGDV